MPFSVQGVQSRVCPHSPRGKWPQGRGDICLQGWSDYRNPKSFWPLESKNSIEPVTEPFLSLWKTDLLWEIKLIGLKKEWPRTEVTMFLFFRFNRYYRNNTFSSEHLYHSFLRKKVDLANGVHLSIFFFSISKKQKEFKCIWPEIRYWCLDANGKHPRFLLDIIS